MNLHRRVVGAFLSTISASKGEQMYHTDVFSLSGCRSVLYSHPKAILSGRGIIGGRHGRQDYPVILSMEIQNGQPEVTMSVSIKSAKFDAKYVAAAERWSRAGRAPDVLSCAAECQR